ncbi:MAG: hypothetical protein ONB44_06480 [candidate division KSB1 bacterium]|nr:hypothetical protein [candidate division KSB1 bacterium]MDZ7301769.1 hypothetical protein [candidate division KSB1 bacterium]MDZ7311452.1 hypothetical protein [candidate division KSB1 bacterium]
MSTPVIFVIYMGVLLLFALIGGIIINHSLKQQKKEKSTTAA